LKLPVANHTTELMRLAKRIGEDVTVLRAEFAEFVGVTEGDSGALSGAEIEPWDEPINVEDLLAGIEIKITKHIVLVQPIQRTAVTLWTAQAWVHNEIATHSPILLATSVEPDAAKSTLFGVLARLMANWSINIEASGPSMFRLIDAHQPALFIDEADDIFVRKNDLKHIINSSWTRGSTIPRVVHGRSYEFNIFSVKAIGLLEGRLPRALRTRCIPIKMVPKRDDIEKAEKFSMVDDAEFALLRRKLKRFAIDYVATLKTLTRRVPFGVSNRVADNWYLMLAIAELAGGQWPERAREAAEKLSRMGRQPSDRVKMLEEFHYLFTEHEKWSAAEFITSEDAAKELRQDPFSVWANYGRGTPITQNQIAFLLRDFDIRPGALHPTKSKNFARQGYRRAQFVDPCARYLPGKPIIQ
jgi:putative DNA primase/helicase